MKLEREISELESEVKRLESDSVEVRMHTAEVEKWCLKFGKVLQKAEATRELK